MSGAKHVFQFDSKAAVGHRKMPSAYHSFASVRRILTKHLYLASRDVVSRTPFPGGRATRWRPPGKAVLRRNTHLGLPCVGRTALGRTFHGKDKAAKILAWLGDSFGPIRFEHRLIMVQGDCFCEEFNFIISDQDARIPATEILIYEDAYIKELRLYVDRIDVAQIAAHNVIEKAIINWIASMSLRDLPW